MPLSVCANRARLPSLPPFLAAAAIIAGGIFLPCGTPNCLWRAPGCLIAPWIKLPAILDCLQRGIACALRVFQGQLGCCKIGLSLHHSRGFLLALSFTYLLVDVRLHLGTGLNLGASSGNTRVVNLGQ